jgi:hypothetical protein
MIPNHPRFLEALNEKKKIRVRLYSIADNGVVDRVCAPMSYGLGVANQDGLNRYWLWDYASQTGSHTLGLLPQEIIDLQMLGEVFDPALFASEPAMAPVPSVEALPPATVPSPDETK